MPCLIDYDLIVYIAVSGVEEKTNQRGRLKFETENSIYYSDYNRIQY